MQTRISIGASSQLVNRGVNMEKRMVKQMVKQGWVLTLGAAFGLAAFAGAAQADPVNFLPANSQILAKYNDLEIQVLPPTGFTGSCTSFVTCGSQTLNGIFDIVTLSAPLGIPVYWTTGLTDNTQLNGRFDGLQVSKIIASGGGFDIFFAGGTETVYNVPNVPNSYNPTSPADPIPPQICGGACPLPWLTLNFVPGIVPLDATTTLFSHVTSLTSPFTGHGDGNLITTGGTAITKFPVGTAFSFSSDLSSCGPGTPPAFAAQCLGAGAWPLVSHDPQIGRTVPEPGTLLLLGLGALGAALARRRRAA